MFPEVKNCTIGSTFEGRFVIESVLGQGGMACVYRARHAQIEKAVALKVLLGSILGNATLRDRFLREVKAAGALDHPNIVKTLASGVTEDGRPWVAMDLIEGEPLSRILEQEAKLSSRRARALLLQIAQGLEFAHANGIIHRDIKPSNIIVTADGANEQALIVDFGLAKEFTQLPEGGQGQTKTTMQGSPAYMSPEQCEAKHTDPRTDVYSFGCLMYEVLTGTSPYEGDSAFEVMFKHVHCEIPAIDSAIKIDSDLKSIMQKCLQKDPAMRFANGGELVGALKAGEIVPVESAPQAVSRKHASPKPLVALLLAIAGAIAFVTVGTDWIARDEQRTRNAANFADRIGFHSMESYLLNQCADKIRNYDKLPAVTDEGMKDVPLERQKQILRYFRLKVDAMLAKIKTDGPLAEAEAIALLRDMVAYIIADGGNLYMNTPEVYDPLVEEVHRLAINVPNIENKFDSDHVKVLSKLAEREAVRGFWGLYPSLIPKAAQTYEIVLKLPLNETTACSAYHCLSLAYLNMAHKATNQSEKDDYLKRAETYREKEVKVRKSMRQGDTYVIPAEAKMAGIEYVRGNKAAARAILHSKFVQFMKRHRQYHSDPQDDAKDDAHYNSAVEFQFSAIDGKALQWAQEQISTAPRDPGQ